MMSEATKEGMGSELRIRASNEWIFLNLPELWSHRDLVALLVRREWVTKYSQTVLGPLWFVAQPLITTLVFVLVFAKVAKLPTDNSPPLLFYLCGMIPWNYFAQTFNGSATVLTANAGLFGKVYFPRLVVPIASVVSNALMMGVQFAMFFVVWLVMHASGSKVPSLAWSALWLIPLAVVQVAALALGAGLLMSSLTARYRDLAHVTAFLIGIWFYLTPIIYPLSSVPQKMRWMMSLNPMTCSLEVFRSALLDSGPVEPELVVWTLISTAALFVIGVVTFQRVQRSFIDSV